MAKPFIKPVVTAREAVRAVEPGAAVMIGGFIYGGVPYTLVDALYDAGTGGLHLISTDTLIVNDEEPAGIGHARLVVSRRVRRVTTSHIGLNRVTQAMYTNGELEVELVPQGTLVERIRAGGYGLGGFLTPTGVGTDHENGKRVIEVDGRRFILELPLRANVALIRAHRADAAGNLTYFGTCRNLNPTMASAADYVVAEVDEVVPIGGIDPDDVVTPGIFIDALVPKGDGHYASRT